MLRLPSGVVEQAGSGDIVSRVTGDVDVVASTVNEILPEVTAALVTISTTIIGLLFLDWRFAVAGALATPIQLHTLRWYLGTSSPIYTAERRAEATRSQSLLDTIGGVETVHAFGLGPRQVEQVTATSSAALDISMKATHLRARFFGRLNLAEVIGLGAILLVGFKLVGDGSATVGQCTAAALYFHRLFDPINVMLFCVDALQSAYAGLARLVGVATMPVPPQADRHPAGEHRAIELEHVSYRYGDRGFAVTGIDLVVPEGATVALVGASGAGKTTLAKIIAGALEPTDGVARVSGTLAMVTQEIHVFTGTLIDDVRLARSDASIDEVTAALDTVGALGWVRALPNGVDTIVGEGGHALDGMQAQQLALARVVLADPRIVVLDEATAEAGSAGAAVLERAARAVLRGRSALVVAHRLSQAVTADLIVVMDEGKIVERGTHDRTRCRWRSLHHAVGSVEPRAGVRHQRLLVLSCKGYLTYDLWRNCWHAPHTCSSTRQKNLSSPRPEFDAAVCSNAPPFARWAWSLH